jgi:hypothetical protein
MQQLPDANSVFELLHHVVVAHAANISDKNAASILMINPEDGGSMHL